MPAPQVREICAGLLAESTFERYFLDLQQLDDSGLCAELLSGTTWTRGTADDDRVHGRLDPGAAFARKGMHRGALDALLLHLVTHAEGPVAAALLEEVEALHLAHSGWSGSTDLAPLAAFPNLRALRLDGCAVRPGPPPLRLDGLDLSETTGIDAGWVARAAPVDFWTDDVAPPPSVVRLRVHGTGAGATPLVVDGLPNLQDLRLNGCHAAVVRECPRLRVVRSEGMMDGPAFGAWSGLPALEVLEVQGDAGAGRRVTLPELPRLKTLVLGGRAVQVDGLPPSVRRLTAALDDLGAVTGLERPVELRLANPGGAEGWPRPHDGSALTLLDLSGRAVRDADLSGVGAFPALERLHLAGTGVTRLDGLAGHPRLAVVDISGCSELADIRALATLPSLKVTLMAGACAMAPADLPVDLQWTVNRQAAPDIGALLHRQPPQVRPRALPRGLPRSAERLYQDVAPLLARRDFSAIDVAIDAIADAGIPELWDWWLDGLQGWAPGEANLCPRRFSQALPDRPYALHATLLLVGTAPPGCRAAETVRQASALKLAFNWLGGATGRFDLSLLAPFAHLESLQLAGMHLVVPDSPRPDWLPRLASLHVHNPTGPRPNQPLDAGQKKSLLAALRSALAHVRDVQVR